MRHNPVIFLIILTSMIGLSACGINKVTPTLTPIPTQTMPPTPQPTPLPPSMGEYQGTNPDPEVFVTISGDHDGWVQISEIDFNLSSPPGYDGLCQSYHSHDIPIKQDGAFSERFTFWSDSSKEIAKFSGKAIGDTIKGDFSISYCDNDDRIDTVTGQWSAKLVKAADPTPVPVPPKTGHYEGIYPTVSFDVQDTPAFGIIVKNFVLNADSCELAEDKADSWRTTLDGSFEKQNLVDITGTVPSIDGILVGDTAHGSYGASGCRGNWSANWVRP